MTAPEVAQRLRAALEAGPTDIAEWRAVRNEVHVGKRRICSHVNGGESLPMGEDHARSVINANFIAAANPIAIRALLDERDALQAKVQEMAGLQRFVGMALQDFPEHGDIDGFTLQDMAVECGLLVEQLVTAPCGETCQCAECGQEGVTMCLRIQPALRSAIDAAIRSSSAPTGEEA